MEGAWGTGDGACIVPNAHKSDSEEEEEDQAEEGASAAACRDDEG